jgi:PAS domain S-box-containing protein
VRLTPRLTLTFVLYAAVLLAVVGLLAYDSGRASLRSATVSELLSTAIEKQGALNAWVEEKRQDIAILAADPAMAAITATLLPSRPGSPEWQAAHDQWLMQVQPPINGGEFTDLMFIELQTGQVLASTDSADEGKFREDQPFFVNGKVGPYIQNLYYLVALQGPAMTAAAPVHAPGGKLLGVVAGRMDLAEMTAIISRRTGLHQTDDAYLVNTSSLFVTQPRFLSDPAVLQRGVHTEAVNRCLTEDSGVVDQRDYRGVPTIAVYRWLRERELCLVVKLDQQEAYAPARAFGRTVAAISVLALLGAALLAVVLAHSLTRPILALQAGAARFGAGERDLRLPSVGKDEIGDLSREFDRMAAALSQQEQALRDHTRSLDAQVQERTAEVRAGEARYQSLFENMLEGLAYCRLLFDGDRPSDFIYLEVNQAFEKLTGLKDVVGRKVSEIIPGIQETNPELFEIYGRVARYGKPERFETFVEGLGIWFSISVYSPGGQEEFVAVFDNITERKQAEAAVQRHAEQLEALNRVARIVSGSLELDEVYDGFVAELRRLMPVDRTSITRIDEARENWTIVRQWTTVEPTLRPGSWHPLEGSVFRELVQTGKPLLESPIDPDGRWVESPLLRDEGMQSRIIVPLVVKDRVTGTVSVAALSPQAFSEADLDMVVPLAAQLALAIENVRLYEKEREYGALLEQRVTERTAELEDANQELEAFSYSVSHDLRAPLRAVDGFSRILLEDHASALDVDARRYLDLVRSSTQQMGRLIDELLAFSRLSRQELVRHPIQPASLARQALEQLEPERAGRSVEIEIEDLPEAKADTTLVRQVYANLLANALKFTRQSSPARIVVGSKVENGETVYFVRDNGVGFDMAYVGKLFGVFQRLHRSEDYEGTGVGLAIVQRIIHRHGGRAWAEGAVDQGATVFFTLPEGSES